MIQTKILQTAFSGLKRDMEPSEISKPSGSANNRVTPKSRQFSPKPVSSCWVTLQY